MQQGLLGGQQGSLPETSFPVDLAVLHAENQFLRQQVVGMARENSSLTAMVEQLQGEVRRLARVSVPEVRCLPLPS